MGSATSGAINESPSAWHLPPTPKRAPRARSLTAGSADRELGSKAPTSNPRDKTYYDGYRDGKHTYTYEHIASSSHSPHSSPRGHTKSFPKVPRSPRSRTSSASLRSDQVQSVAHSEPPEKVQEASVNEEPFASVVEPAAPTEEIAHDVPKIQDTLSTKLEDVTTGEADSISSSTDQADMSTVPSENEHAFHPELDTVSTVTTSAKSEPAASGMTMAPLGPSARVPPATLTSKARLADEPHQVGTSHNLPIVPEESPKVGSIPLLAHEQAEPVDLARSVDPAPQRASTPPQGDNYHSLIASSPRSPKRSPIAVSIIVPSSPSRSRSSASGSPLPVHPLENPLEALRYPSTLASMIVPPSAQFSSRPHPTQTPRRTSMPPPQVSHDLTSNHDNGNLLTGNAPTHDSSPSSLLHNHVPSRLRSRSSKMFTFRNHDSSDSTAQSPTEPSVARKQSKVHEVSSSSNSDNKTLKRRQSSLTKRASTLFHLGTHRKSAPENEPPPLPMDASRSMNFHGVPSPAGEHNRTSGIKPPTATRPRAATYQSHSSYASASTYQ